MSEKTTLHLITHTHWDREWYQPFQAFRMRLVHLIDHLLSIFEKDPKFLYFMLDGQTIVLEDYLAIRPEREGQIRTLIQSGRLLIGPWYILSDEFLVSTEAIVRNLLEGRRLCRKYGGMMPVGYIPDPFGHIGQMPQILRNFGIDTACFWRGLDDEPCEVTWAAPDGSEVLTGFLRESYSNATALPMEDPSDFVAESSRLGHILAAHAQTQHLLLMNGTDHAEPSPATSARIREAQGQMVDFEIRHSTLPEYFQALKAEILERQLELPRVQGELRACKRSPLLPGVLSSRMWIKQRNHACQNLLECWAEPFDAWASALQITDPLTSSYLSDRTALIHEAWCILLQCHPHDSICGCSIDQVHEEMRPRFDQVEQIGEEVTRQSLEIITSQVNLNPPVALRAVSNALIVFNPTQSVRTDRVEGVFNLPEDASGFEILDESGEILPHQFTGSDGQKLFSATLDRESFLNTISMVKDGNVAGLTVQTFRVLRRESRLDLDVTLSGEAQVNLEAWKLGIAEVKSFIADPTLNVFYVYAHSPSFARFTFVARDVPGLGYRTFWVRALPADHKSAKPVHLNPLLRAVLPLTRKLLQSPMVGRLIGRFINHSQKEEVASIENEFFKISVDPQTGTINLLDKRSHQIFLGLNRFVDGGDRGDTYNYCPPEIDHLVSAQVRGIRIQPGNVESIIELEYSLFAHRGLSANREARSSARGMIPIRCRIRLVKGAARVEIRTEIDNQTQDHRLRVHFPIPFMISSAEYDGHFERMTRPLGIPPADSSWIEQPRPEVPQRRYTLVRQNDSGFLLAARGLPEVETVSTGSGCEIRLTLLRCVGWLSRDDLASRKLHAGPGLETPGAQMAGMHVFEYALIPFSYGSQDAIHEALAFDLPLRCLSKTIHPGCLPPAQSLFKINPEFELTSIKTADDGDGIILRGYQPAAGKVTVTTSLPMETCNQVRMDETDVAGLVVDGSGKVEISSRDWEVITLKWKNK